MLKIGLAFAGNDGAYQVGVWKALKQAGVDNYINAVAGTLAGGVNAALFLQGDDGIAEHLWANASQEGFTSEEMGGIIDRYLNMEIFDGKNCYLAYSEKKNEFIFFNMKGVAIENRKEKLLDESGEGCIPIGPLYLQENCDIILAVHPKMPADAINFSKFRNTEIIEIVPEDEGEAFDAKKRMEQGYNDALHISVNLKKELDMEIENLLRVDSADDRKKVYQEIRKRKQKKESF